MAIPIGSIPRASSLGGSWTVHQVAWPELFKVTVGAFQPPSEATVTLTGHSAGPRRAKGRPTTACSRNRNNNNKTSKYTVV